jgi:hypothetical protein
LAHKDRHALFLEKRRGRYTGKFCSPGDEKNMGGSKMAKITVFECDVCKAQSKKINSLRFEMATILLSNEENKPTVGTPTIARYEVCSDKCAIEALSRMLEVDIVEGDEVSSGRPVNNLQLTLEVMPS